MNTEGLLISQTIGSRNVQCVGAESMDSSIPYRVCQYIIPAELQRMYLSGQGSSY